MGTIPTDPDPPILVEKGVKHLTLSWAQRPIDEAFTLQMNDEANYFRNKYTGPLCNYTVTDLFRNTEYKFRVSRIGFFHWMSDDDYDLVGSTQPRRTK